MSRITIQDFQHLQSFTDFANFLGFAPKKLSYILYKLGDGPNGQYKEFEIKKRSGGARAIAAPNTGLKSIQKCLADKLSDIYMVKKPVHGFVNGRNILSNAKMHSRKRLVFKVDLKDFFPSIHFGRVRGLFSSRPYEFKRDIAIIIAKIACFNDSLPQGSPCSPVISNMICAYLDKQLGEMAKSFGCYYTRYADDLTFSTNKKIFPEGIAALVNSKWEAGVVLKKIVEDNTFTINVEKYSMRTRSDRQLVTGIVVNDYPNIRRKSIKQVRSMLHDWKVSGLTEAQEKYKNNFDLANREPPKDGNIYFPNVVRGKLEYIRHVRGYRIDLLNKIDEEECIRNRLIYKKKDLQTIPRDQYYKYFQRLEQLLFRDCGVPTILGEGETDWMHLRKAFSHFKAIGKFAELELNIHKHKGYSTGGVTHLNDICANAESLYVKFQMPVICVYDCDIPDITLRHNSSKDGYIYHGNNVYSIVLTKPSHRTVSSFAIEQLYLDKDLLKTNKHKRRIFLSTEFEPDGKLKKDATVIYGKKARDGKEITGWKKTITGVEKIIDNGVCTDRGGKLTNLALSKKDFAIMIMKNEPPFNRMDFSGFKGVFDLIQKICTLSRC
jgi:RNA-directed DNA polymerase